MDVTEARHRGALFRELHEAAGVLVLPNPWDQGTARILTHMGFKGLATTSAGLAFSLGRRDGAGAVGADETFTHIAAIIASTHLPVSADLENGFGGVPETVAATIRRAGDVGLSGASIEDATYRNDDPILYRSLAVERIHAAVEAARALPYPFTLTARSENFVRGRPDLDDTLWRLAAFEKAGADVLYAPGLPDEHALRAAVSVLERPLNHVAGIGPSRLSIRELGALGVRRVTIGTSFVRTALAAMIAAAREVRDEGTFGFLDGVPGLAEFNELIDPTPSA